MMTLDGIRSVLEKAISSESKLTDQFSAGRVHGLRFALSMLVEHMDGYDKWNAENVALHIKNDERLYDVAKSIIACHLDAGGSLEDAAEEFAESYEGETTIDGATFRLDDVLTAMIAIHEVER